MPVPAHGSSSLSMSSCSSFHSFSGRKSHQSASYPFDSAGFLFPRGRPTWSAPGRVGTARGNLTTGDPRQLRSAGLSVKPLGATAVSIPTPPRDPRAQTPAKVQTVDTWPSETVSSMDQNYAWVLTPCREPLTGSWSTVRARCSHPLKALITCLERARLHVSVHSPRKVRE